MDSYKPSVIKADEIITSGRQVLLSRKFPESENTAVKQPTEAVSSPASELTKKEKLKAEIEKNISRVSDESYRKGFTAGVESQKKEIAPVLEALSTMTRMIPLIDKHITARTEQQILKLSFAIAEKIINLEVTTNKDVIFGVLQGVAKNISATEGMKIRLHPQDLHYITEMKKDFLQSIEGVRNAVFEEDASIKRGGAIVETMFGEVDARLESQLKEIREAMLKL